MVREVTLQVERLLEQVRRNRDDLKAHAELGLQGIVVMGRTSRVQLFELADRAKEQKGGTSFEWGAPTEVFQPSGEIVGLYGDQFLAVESQTLDSAADSSFEAILNWDALVDQR